MKIPKELENNWYNLLMKTRYFFCSLDILEEKGQNRYLTLNLLLLIKGSNYTRDINSQTALKFNVPYFFSIFY